MIEVNAVKLRTIGERQCLSLPKEEPKDLDMTTNRIINDLATFQLQLDNFKSSLKKQFSSFKQSFIAEVLQFKNEILRKQKRILMETSRKSYSNKWKNKVPYYMIN